MRAIGEDCSDVDEDVDEESLFESMKCRICDAARDAMKWAPTIAISGVSVSAIRSLDEKPTRSI